MIGADGLSPGLSRADRRELQMAAGVFSPGMESLVVTVVAALYSGASAGAAAGNCAGSTIPGCANRQGGKGYHDRLIAHGASAVAGGLGVNRCGGPLIRHPHLQRGFHGDHGEPEHTEVGASPLISANPPVNVGDHLAQGAVLGIEVVEQIVVVVVFTHNQYSTNTPTGIGIRFRARRIIGRRWLGCTRPVRRLVAPAPQRRRNLRGRSIPPRVTLERKAYGGTHDGW